MPRRWSATFEQELRDRLYPGQMTIEEELSQNSDLDDPPSRGVPVSDRTLLDEVRTAHAAVATARHAFLVAVWRARDAGLGNAKIGRQVGMTEGGIRMLLQRNRRPRELGT